MHVRGTTVMLVIGKGFNMYINICFLKNMIYVCITVELELKEYEYDYYSLIGIAIGMWILILIILSDYWTFSAKKNRT